MSLIDEPIPVGAPVEPRNGHTPMHANEPTWCKDCGKPVNWWAFGPLCLHVGAALYDTDTAAGRQMILENLGVSR